MEVEKIEQVEEKKRYDWLKHVLSGLVSTVCLSAVVVVMLGMVRQVHPEQIRESDLQKDELSLNNQIRKEVENVKIDVLNSYLSSNGVIRKIYSIEKGSPVPAPKSENFVSVNPADAACIEAVIEQAESYGLLHKEDVVFRPDVYFYENSTIEYYLDETIFALCWQEVVGNSVVSFAEVKVADPSQFRRKLAGDTYGSGKLMYCTEMYRQSNAVVAMNADFYSFRNLGITCYDGKIYRTEDNLDTLFVDKNGDFIFYPRKQGASADELQKFVDENNIDFSIAFGPVLIENGELREITGYPIGEVLQIYSRAAICQVDSLHYLYAHVGHYGGGRKVVNVNTFSKMLYDKGVRHAYNIDGGQTGELIINGKIRNSIDFGSERTVSDMIYFATALPN